MIEKISRTLNTISACFLILMASAILLQVFARYILGAVVPWTEEIARYFCIWMVFTGSITAIIKNKHIRITFFLDTFPPKIKVFFEGLAHFLMILFCLVLLFGSFQLVGQNWAQQAVTFPLSVGMLYIPVGIFAFFTIMAIVIKVHKGGS